MFLWDQTVQLFVGDEERSNLFCNYFLLQWGVVVAAAAIVAVIVVPADAGGAERLECPSRLGRERGVCEACILLTAQVLWTTWA